MVALKELITRPIIRTDQSSEVFNKMTDDELNEWEERHDRIIEEKLIYDPSSTYGSLYTSHVIDFDILYRNIF